MTSGMEESMDSLRQSEKDELEQRIIAYFEGGLDKEASNSLLADVAKSPAARVLFNSHKNLASIISSARIPLETPLAVKESIAERIPGLVAWIPGLLGTAQLAPIVSQSANPIVAFFTKMSLTTAVSVASSVAVLTTAGVIVKNKLDDNAAKSHKTVVAQRIQPATPNAAEAPQYYSALPQRDLSSPNLGSANGTEASESIQKTEGTKATKSAAPITKHSIRENAPAMTPAPNKSIAQHTTQQQSAVSTPSNESAPPAKEEPPTATISNVAPLAPQAARGDIPTIPTNLSTLPMLLGEGDGIRPFVSLGTRVQFLTADKGSGDIQSDGQLGSIDFRLGADISLVGDLAVRIQGGYSGFAHETDRTDTRTFGSQQVTEQYTTLKSDPVAWASAGLAYQLYAADAVPLTLSASAGEAFYGKPAPLAEFGISTEIAVNDQFAIRPNFTFDAVWSGVDNKMQASNTSIVIDHRFNNGNLMSASFGISVGVLYHF